VNWGIAVEERTDCYEGLSDEEGIAMQNRAMELTEQAAEGLAEEIRGELGVGYVVRFAV
jgi:hypothetical protein